MGCRHLECCVTHALRESLPGLPSCPQAFLHKVEEALPWGVGGGSEVGGRGGRGRGCSSEHGVRRLGGALVLPWQVCVDSPRFLLSTMRGVASTHRGTGE